MFADASLAPPTGKRCRICLQQGDDVRLGLLFAPCNCKGSSRYVHRRCLDYWRSTGINPSNMTSCEICLHQFNFASRGAAWKMRCAVWAVIILETSIFALLASAVGSCLKARDVFGDVRVGDAKFVTIRSDCAYFVYGCLFNLWCIGIFARMPACIGECRTYSTEKCLRRLMRRVIAGATAGHSKDSLSMWVQQARAQRRSCPTRNCATCRDTSRLLGSCWNCVCTAGCSVLSCCYCPLDDWCLICEAGLPWRCCGMQCCWICSGAFPEDALTLGSEICSECGKGADGCGATASSPVLCCSGLLISALIVVLMIFAAVVLGIVYVVPRHQTDVRLVLSRGFAVLACEEEDDEEEDQHGNPLPPEPARTPKCGHMGLADKQGNQPAPELIECMHQGTEDPEPTWVLIDERGITLAHEPMNVAESQPQTLAPAMQIPMPDHGSSSLATRCSKCSL